MTGFWDVATNVYSLCTGSQPTVSTAHLVPPYAYSLEAATDLPASVPAGAGVGKL